MPTSLRKAVYIVSAMTSDTSRERHHTCCPKQQHTTLVKAEAVALLLKVLKVLVAQDDHMLVSMTSLEGVFGVAAKAQSILGCGEALQRGEYDLSSMVPKIYAAAAALKSLKHTLCQAAMCMSRGCRTHLIQDVDGCRLEEQHGQNKGQGQQGALPSTQLTQALLPHITEANLHHPARIP